MSEVIDIKTGQRMEQSGAVPRFVLEFFKDPDRILFNGMHEDAAFVRKAAIDCANAAINLFIIAAVKENNPGAVPLMFACLFNDQHVVLNAYNTPDMTTEQTIDILKRHAPGLLAQAIAGMENLACTPTQSPTH